MSCLMADSLSLIATLTYNKIQHFVSTFSLLSCHSDMRSQDLTMCSWHRMSMFVCVWSMSSVCYTESKLSLIVKGQGSLRRRQAQRMEARVVAHLACWIYCLQNCIHFIMGRMTSDTFQCRRILISTIRFPECCTNMDGLQGAVASSDVSCSIPNGTGVLKSKKAGWCHCTDGRNEKEASLVSYFTTQNPARVCSPQLSTICGKSVREVILLLFCILIHTQTHTCTYTLLTS